MISLILAAGKGTRMKSNRPKVIHKVNGVPMLKKIINVLEESGISENILILGYEKEKILEVLGENIDYVVQKEQLGTGDAIRQAKERLKDYHGDVIVLCGDTPLIKSETLKEFYNYHKMKKAVTTILTANFENPFGYGRIVYKNGEIQGIVEEKEATQEIKEIKEVNGGIYCFNSKELFKALEKIDNNNEKGEYYLTDVIKIQRMEDKIIETFKLDDSMEILGINSKVELSQGAEVLRERVNYRLMEEGVILIDPKTTYIEESVKIGRDTTIYPGILLQGDTVIGEGCEIIGNTRIIDSVIGNNVRIESSVIENSKVENAVTIGPFAHLRPKTYLKENVHIGNFVEVKNSTLERGVKAGHLTYLGDAQIGEKTNIGAGTVTCNYDGKNKYKTVIGKEAFIGSDTMLVAPVTVGDKGVTAAGSTITKDIPSNALGVARSKQVIKENWRKN